MALVRGSKVANQLHSVFEFASKYPKTYCDFRKYIHKGMDSEILKDLLVHSDYNNLTCHQHKEIFGNQSHYYSCRPEDPEFYDCHPEILWKDINVSLFVNIHLSSHLNVCKIFTSKVISVI